MKPVLLLFTLLVLVLPMVPVAATDCLPQASGELLLTPSEAIAGPGDRVSFRIHLEGSNKAGNLTASWEPVAASEDLIFREGERETTPQGEALVNATIEVRPGAPEGTFRLHLEGPADESPDHPPHEAEDPSDTEAIIPGCPPPRLSGTFTLTVSTKPTIVESRVEVAAMWGETAWTNLTIFNPGTVDSPLLRLCVEPIVGNCTRGFWNATLPEPFLLPAKGSRTFLVGFTPGKDASFEQYVYLALEEADAPHTRHGFTTIVLRLALWDLRMESDLPTVAIGPGEEGAFEVKIWREGAKEEVEVRLFWLGPLGPHHGLEIHSQPGVTVPRGGKPVRIPVVVQTFPNASPMYNISLEARLPTSGVLTRLPITILVDPMASRVTEGPTENTREALAAAAAAVGACALALVMVHRRFPLLAIALFTRLRPARITEQPVRRAIVDLVKKEPGITIAEARRRLGIANGQAIHHVRQLAHARVLLVTRDGRARRLTLALHGPATTVEQRILERLQETPVPVRDLALALGLTPQAAHRHIRRLHAEGRVDLRFEGRRLVAQRVA